MATVTRKGQITIPKDVRDALGLAPGSQVEFTIEAGRAILRRRVPAEAFDRWQGFLRGKLPFDSVDDMLDALRGERSPREDGAE